MVELSRKQGFDVNGDHDSVGQTAARVLDSSPRRSEMFIGDDWNMPLTLEGERFIETGVRGPTPLRGAMIPPSFGDLFIPVGPPQTFHPS